MNRKNLPLNKSDFKNVIKGNYYFVDKSMFINQLLKDDSDIILLPRPRRFGKTLNISMLRYFFEKTEQSNAYLFENLAIRKQETWGHQGKYPVIYITLKDVHGKNWDACFDLMKYCIGEEYARHKYLLKSDILSKDEKKIYKAVINQNANDIYYKVALKKLSRYLHHYHSNQVIILCDEYDSPIHAGYAHGYYDDVIDFMRIFLGSAYKDNHSLHKGVLTGILRIGRESIFSDLNNIDVYSILFEKYSEFFGFTKTEVQQILIDFQLIDHQEIIEQTYDGYKFGNNIIYNPWSLIHYCSQPNQGPIPYWMNTSENLLIRQLIFQQHTLNISDIQNLIDGKPVWKELKENIVMKDLKMFRVAVWSLLVFSGYLTVTDKRRYLQNEYCLKIPNNEVRDFFRHEMEYLKNNDEYKALLRSEKQAKTVFISYNHKDMAFVERLKQDLENSKIPLIIDIESMQFGDEISDFIEKSIQESDITISVISKNSLGSPWVMVETLETLLSETFDKRKRYIPVMIDDCLFKDKFQSVLIKNIEKNIDEIVDEISHLSKKYVQTDSLYARQKRLINLRSNIDIILFRLKEVLVANFITEEEYLKNFSRLIHFITQ